MSARLMFIVAALALHPLTQAAECSAAAVLSPVCKLFGTAIAAPPAEVCASIVTLSDQV
jgi:hypothetical protein